MPLTVEQAQGRVPVNPYHHPWRPGLHQHREVMDRVQEAFDAGSRRLLIDFWTSGVHGELGARGVAQRGAGHDRPGPARPGGGGRRSRGGSAKASRKAQSTSVGGPPAAGHADARADGHAGGLRDAIAIALRRSTASERRGRGCTAVPPGARRLLDPDTAEGACPRDRCGRSRGATWRSSPRNGVRRERRGGGRIHREVLGGHWRGDPTTSYACGWSERPPARRQRSIVGGPSYRARLGGCVGLSSFEA